MDVRHVVARPVSGTRSQLGEGPVWSPRDGELLWTDISGHILYAFNPQTGRDRILANTAPWRVGCFARCTCTEPWLLVAAETNFYLCDLRTTPTQRQPIFRSIASTSDLATSGTAVRFNDGKVAPSGHFIAGTMSDVKPRVTGSASVFALGTDGRCVRVDAFGGVTVSNGLAWTRDGHTLYYVDTPTKRIVRFGFDPQSGAVLGPAAKVFELGTLPGGFDGMTIDVDGRLWVALFRGSQVVCVDVNVSPARVVAVVDVPAKLVTSCCFGGADLRTLYITTASGEEDAGNPLAGALFAADVGAAGLPLFEFDANALLKH